MLHECYCSPQFLCVLIHSQVLGEITTFFPFMHSSPQSCTSEGSNGDDPLPIQTYKGNLVHFYQGEVKILLVLL